MNNVKILGDDIPEISGIPMVDVSWSISTPQDVFASYHIQETPYRLVWHAYKAIVPGDTLQSAEGFLHMFDMFKHLETDGHISRLHSQFLSTSVSPPVRSEQVAASRVLK